MKISGGDVGASFEMEFPQEEMDAVLRGLQKLGTDVAGGPRTIGASATYAVVVHETHPTHGKWFVNAVMDNALRIGKGLIERAMSGGPRGDAIKGKVMKQWGELLIGEAVQRCKKVTGFLARSHFNVEVGEDIPKVEK